MSESTKNHFKHLNFPEKLWILVNDERRKSFAWSQVGNSVLLNAKYFHKDCRSLALFKTNKFSSIIRQLNLYGFEKLPGSGIEYYHRNFLRNRYDLLHYVKRHSSRLEKRPTKLEEKLFNITSGEKHSNTATGALTTACFQNSSNEVFQRDGRRLDEEPLYTCCEGQRYKKNTASKPIGSGVGRSRGRQRKKLTEQGYNGEFNILEPLKEKSQLSASYSPSIENKICQLNYLQSSQYNSGYINFQDETIRKSRKRTHSFDRVKNVYCSLPVYERGILCPTKLLLKRQLLPMGKEFKANNTNTEQVQIQTESFEETRSSDESNCTGDVGNIKVMLPREKIPKHRERNAEYSKHDPGKQVTCGMPMQDNCEGNQYHITDKSVKTTLFNCETPKIEKQSVSSAYDSGETLTCGMNKDENRDNKQHNILNYSKRIIDRSITTSLSCRKAPTLTKLTNKATKNDAKVNHTCNINGSENYDADQHRILSCSGHIVVENVKMLKLIFKTPTRSKCNVSRTNNSPEPTASSIFESQNFEANQVRDTKEIDDVSAKNPLSSHMMNEESQRYDPLIRSCHDEVKHFLSEPTGIEENLETTRPLLCYPIEQQTFEERIEFTTHFSSSSEDFLTETSTSEVPLSSPVWNVESPAFPFLRSDKLDCLISCSNYKKDKNDDLYEWLLSDEIAINNSASDDSWQSEFTSETVESTSSGRSETSFSSSPSANSVTCDRQTFEYRCTFHDYTTEELHLDPSSFQDSLKNICNPNVPPTFVLKRCNDFTQFSHFSNTDLDAEGDRLRV